MNRRQFISTTANLALASGVYVVAGPGMLLQGAPTEAAQSVPPAPLDELRLAINAHDGSVLVPGVDPMEGLANFNERIKVVPRVIVECKTPLAVSETILWAKRFGISIRGRSGGHSFEGFSLVDGAVIDVKPMNNVMVDPVSHTAKIGAGTRLEKINDTLFSHGFGLSAGSCPGVGIAGLTLGGGHGLSSRKFGLTADSLLSLTMVDASGNTLTASSTTNSDLLWASKGGGGGNFGVVTEFEFKVQPVNRVLVFSISWRSPFAARVLANWQEFAPFAPDELTCHLTIDCGPGGIRRVHCGGQLLPEEAGETPSIVKLSKMLRPLSSIPHFSFAILGRSFLGSAEHFYGNDAPQVFFKAKSDYADQLLSTDAIADVVRQLNEQEWPRGSTGAISLIFEAYGGAIARVTPEAAAFPHRTNTLFCVQYYTEWENARDTAQRLQQIGDLYDAVHPHFSGFAYVNYPDLDLVDWQRAYYRDNLQRLRQVKTTYDPQNTFNFPQSIPLA
jgi:FAD/FMN-containing dehydrogenase